MRTLNYKMTSFITSSNFSNTDCQYIPFKNSNLRKQKIRFHSHLIIQRADRLILRSFLYKFKRDVQPSCTFKDKNVNFSWTGLFLPETGQTDSFWRFKYQKNYEGVSLVSSLQPFIEKKFEFCSFKWQRFLKIGYPILKMGLLRIRLFHLFPQILIWIVW